jgi:hypothetical protein
MTRHKIILPVLIALVGALFFLPFLGAVHLFDWDEINFAESAREMLVTGNFSKVQIDYQPFWEKPPLFFWLQAGSMQLFGVNEFAARLPNAITGIITLLTFFFIGRKMYDQRFGILWALCMIGSFLPHLYFKSGIIDPLFNYFIFTGIYSLLLLVAEFGKPRISKYAILSGILIGLATLTKGPVALLITLLTVGTYWATVRFRIITSWKNLLLFTVAYAATAGIWFAVDIHENGIGFVKQFIDYQVELFTQPVAGHGEPFYYHFIVVFLGCFPMSVVALPAFFKRDGNSSPFQIKKWMVILFWVVLILFSIVRTKIVHYSSLTYFPLSFLAATVIYNAWKSELPLRKWMLLLITFIGFLFSLLLTAAPWLAQHKQLLIPYLKDPFAVDCLSVDVIWQGWEFLIGIFYFLSILTAVVFLWKNQTRKGAAILFGSTALSLLVYLKVVVPKIESYSQRPAIEFYESLQGQPVYVTTVGFKSYAQFFYFRKPPGDGLQKEEEWLLKGKLDRPAYFVVKTTFMENMKQYPDIEFLSRKGGFAFYVRKPAL